MSMSSRVVVEEISGVLALYSDATVERPTAGNPLATHVPPSNNSFVDGVATRDVDVDRIAGVWVRNYLPESTFDGPPGQKRRVPLLIHFHGGGFCVSHVDWKMYYHFYARLAKASAAMCVSVD